MRDCVNENVLRHKQNSEKERKRQKQNDFYDKNLVEPFAVLWLLFLLILFLFLNLKRKTNQKSTSTWRYSTQSTKLIRFFRHLSLPTRLGWLKTQLCLCCMSNIIFVVIYALTRALSLVLKYPAVAVFISFIPSLPLLVHSQRQHSTHTCCLDFIQHSFLCRCMQFFFFFYDCCLCCCCCRAVDAAGFEFDTYMHCTPQWDTQTQT